MNRQISHGLIVGVAYTLSKTFVTNNTDTDSVNPFNTRAYEYRIAANDQLHNIASNYVYNLPGPAHYRGQRTDREGGSERLGNRRRHDLPDGHAHRTFALDQRRQHRAGDHRFLYLRPAVLSKPAEPDYSRRRRQRRTHQRQFVLSRPAGRTRSVAPNLHSEPWTDNTDLSLYKNFKVNSDGKKYLQLRLEAFNASQPHAVQRL